MKNGNTLAPMLNLYPDSIGGTLKNIAALLESEELRNTFGSIYVLPSIYNTDLDRGFSVIDYNINELFATAEDLEKLKTLGLDLKLDFILKMCIRDRFDIVYMHEYDVSYWKNAPMAPDSRLLPQALPYRKEDLVSLAESKVCTVSDGCTLDLGGRTETVIHTPGHSAGNCMVLDDKIGILFSGDAILSTPTLVIDGLDVYKRQDKYRGLCRKGTGPAVCCTA